MEIAALSNGEMIVYQNIARDCGVSAPTAKANFELLEQTLLGHIVPAYTRRVRRRTIHAPRFYFFLDLVDKDAVHMRLFLFGCDIAVGGDELHEVRSVDSFLA